LNAQSQIKLTANQAAALMADVAEINHLRQVLEIRSSLHARHRDALVKDANLDPANMQSFEVKQVGEQHILIVTAKGETHAQ
jgi:hypothetical protein